MASSEVWYREACVDVHPQHVVVAKVEQHFAKLEPEKGILLDGLAAERPECTK
jgi:hypothetical protein